MSKRRILLGIGVFVVLYCAAYFMLRKSHVITHFSNATHWHPEKRSADHFIVTEDRSLSDKAVKIVFLPAMMAEQEFHNARG